MRIEGYKMQGRAGVEVFVSRIRNIDPWPEPL